MLLRVITSWTPSGRNNKSASNRTRDISEITIPCSTCLPVSENTLRLCHCKSRPRLCVKVIILEHCILEIATNRQWAVSYQGSWQWYL